MEYTEKATFAELEEWKRLTKHLIAAGQTGTLDAGMQEYGSNTPKNKRVWQLRNASEDMYEACKKALHTLDSMTTKDFETDRDKPVRELLAKVLAKAEGKR